MVLPVLFGGLPGGQELLVLLVLAVIVSVLPAYFVYTDAKRRNNDDAVLWTVATLLGGLVGSILGALLVVVLYLIVGRD